MSAIEQAAYEAAVETVSLRRVRFVQQPSPKAERVIEFSHPRKRTAVAERLPLEKLATVEASLEKNEVLVLLLAGGVETSFTLRRLAEEWVGKTAGAVDPPMQVMVQSDQVLWRQGKAVVIAAPDRWDQILIAIADFTFHEAQLRELEDYVHSCWEDAETDVSLLHDVKDAAMARLPRVNERTEELALARMRFARMLEPLEKPSVALPSHARRLIGELLVYTGVEQRLEFVDERLEALEEIYEVAAERLVSFSYHRAETRLELSIVALLFLEVLLLLWQILWEHGAL